MDAMALPALPRCGVPLPNQIYVLAGQFVPTQAVSFEAICRSDSFSAENVYLLRDGPEVVLVDAMADSALVVELQALRDGTMNLDVGEDVSGDRLPSGIELSIPVLVQPPHPEDATVLPRGHLLFEPFGGWAKGLLVAEPGTELHLPPYL
jgi:hypothetical protein